MYKDINNITFDNMDINLQENFLHITGAKTIKQSLVAKSNLLEKITTLKNYFLV